MRKDDVADGALPEKPAVQRGNEVTVKMAPSPDDEDAPPRHEILRGRALVAPSADVATIKLLAEDPSEAYLATRSEHALPAPRSRALLVIAALAASLGLVLSVGRHFIVRGSDEPGTFLPVAFELPVEAREGEASVVFRGSAPGEDDRARAGVLLQEAEAALKARSLGEARQKLSQCIELADVPDCHRHLGFLLALSGDLGARAHLSRFLALAPDTPDAVSIRSLLAATGTVSTAAP